MASPFVHLHLHTDYSMLDGACKVKDLVKRAADLGMPAVAVTDHGNMCAAIDLYKACADEKKESGREVKAIIGCEFYVAPVPLKENGAPSPAARDAKIPFISGYHLILLAESNEGYVNLCRLNSAAHLDGFYYKPRIDKELLRKHSAGLICLTACIGGEVPAKFLMSGKLAARQALEEYLEIFGKDRLFLEIQKHPTTAEERRRMEEAGTADENDTGEREEKANAFLAAMAREYGLGLVATNDAHYLAREDAEAHEVLLCIGTQTTTDDPKRMRFNASEYYVKSAEEMDGLFRHLPEALENTVRIAERCNVGFPLGKELHYPVYPLPPAFKGTREAYLHAICVEGMKERYGFDPAAPGLTEEQRAKVARMDYELNTIAEKGFTSYYLVVWDFLHYARSQGIPVGPGRGSGAGSIAAFLTHITDIDPIRYGLLFERFLNPGRKSPPDFDIDLCERRRQEVIEYVRGKYGADSVAQIGTFGTLKAKAALKDVARATGRPFADGNLLTKFIPGNDPKMTLKKALKGYKDKDSGKEVPPVREFVDFVENTPWAQQILKYCKIIEGLNRNMSIHAAGVIIGDQRLDNLVPLGRGANEEVITQFAAPVCEELGLLKMDFLGLKTLTIIDDAVKLIAETAGVKIDFDTLTLEDKKTYELLNRGDTIGVFQLESGGFQQVCRQMGVDRIEDISALVAIYRPGPMQFIPEYCDYKFGRKPLEYDHPAMEPILKETYGIMLYQEQVMQVVQAVAGFSLGDADILRRAMGKKKMEEMVKMNAQFVEGCAKNGVARETADAIWEKIVKFAGYGFNKSHSAAYGMLSYRTAYLKANYPVQFMAAMLTSELGNADKLAFYLQATRDMGIDVKQPDVNVSGRTFSVDGSCIRFGLAAIKGVGEGAADAIAGARKADGPFKSLDDFCERVGAKLNRRVMECLCKAGALDGFGLKRSQVFAALEETLARAAVAAADRDKGQGSLFEMFDAGSGGSAAVHPPPPDIPEWPDRERLAYEKALLGVYVTGNPLREYEGVLRSFQTCTPDRLPELVEAAQGNGGGTPVVRLGGLVNNLELKRSKKDNRQWAVVGLECLGGGIECLVFADAYEKCAAALQPEAVVFIEGAAVRKDAGGMPAGDGGEGEEEQVVINLRADKVVPVAEAPGLFTEEVSVRFAQAKTDRARLMQFKKLCEANPGAAPLLLCVDGTDGVMAVVRPGGMKVANSLDFRRAVLDLFGPGCITEKAKKPEGRPQRRFPPGGFPPRGSNDE